MRTTFKTVLNVCQSRCQKVTIFIGQERIAHKAAAWEKRVYKGKNKDKLGAKPNKYSQLYNLLSIWEYVVSRVMREVFVL